jgi:hypothetical protein
VSSGRAWYPTALRRRPEESLNKPSGAIRDPRSGFPDPLDSKSRIEERRDVEIYGIPRVFALRFRARVLLVIGTTADAGL